MIQKYEWYVLHNAYHASIILPGSVAYFTGALTCVYTEIFCLKLKCKQIEIIKMLLTNTREVWSWFEHIYIDWENKNQWKGLWWIKPSVWIIHDLHFINPDNPGWIFYNENAIDLHRMI